MTDLQLPNRIIAYGEEALGERVNVYHKMKTLSLVFDAMDDEEREWIRSTSFGVCQSLTGPFTILRPMCVPQVQSASGSGMMAVFLIHAHATGGLEECVEVNVDHLESEIKRFVSAIILAGVA
ncbi:hypothetical protein CARUB_v10006038mg [Capsella rubella]|uniref:Uncharacterized protein n=1 Tax=Capsella rubella TaxID=81985 RepID=R0GLA7_9BRAS|nr:hypothetical protein CARUB_v10006038mg [Capsella rubella]